MDVPTGRINDLLQQRAFLDRDGAVDQAAVHHHQCLGNCSVERCRFVILVGPECLYELPQPGLPLSLGRGEASTGLVRAGGDDQRVVELRCLPQGFGPIAFRHVDAMMGETGGRSVTVELGATPGEAPPTRRDARRPRPHRALRLWWEDHR